MPNGRATVFSDGRISTCCFDSDGCGVVGDIDELIKSTEEALADQYIHQEPERKARLEKELYDLKLEDALIDTFGELRDRSRADVQNARNVFETTFEREVYSDLTGERSVLMGMIQGAFSAQYEVLREKGHSPSEAYNETVEEALISLYPLIADQGMDW